MLLLALALQAASAPSPDALALAKRLAAGGTLANLLPEMVEKDLTELAAERPTLTEAQQDRIIATGKALAATHIKELIDRMARGYARRLSLADLKELVAAAESPAAQRKRAADIPVTSEAMAAMGSFDLKKETAAKMCAEAKLLCERK